MPTRTLLLSRAPAHHHDFSVHLHVHALLHAGETGLPAHEVCLDAIEQCRTQQQGSNHHGCGRFRDWCQRACTTKCVNVACWVIVECVLMPTVPSLGPGGQGIVPAVSETPGVCPCAGLSAPLLLVSDPSGAGQWCGIAASRCQLSNC